VPDALADSLSVGVIRIGASGAIVWANSTFVRWTDRGEGDLVGRAFADFISSPHTGGPAAEPQLPSLVFLTPGDGPDRPVLMDSSATGDGESLVVLFDASAQRAFAEELSGRHALTRRTQNRLELVISASIAFAEAATEAELAAILVETAAQAFAAEEAVVYLLDEDGAFQQVCGVNPFGSLPDADALAFQGRALRSVMKISGIAEARAVSPSVASAFEASGVQSMVVAPIYHGNDPLGMLGVFFHHPRQFDEQASPLANALAGQAARAVANLRLGALLRHAATHDETTGLPNRRLLEEYLEGNLEQQQDFVAVIFIDLDGFKSINDHLGHQTGDDLLREAGRRLQAAVRADDLVARFGGDEFVVVCQVASESAASEVAERIRETLAAPYAILPDGFAISASVGLSVDESPTLAAGADHMLRAADQAMYRAKAAGGNRLVTQELIP
jgi:diguanylate cyclase (GGDEF)-like protein